MTTTVLDKAGKFLIRDALKCKRLSTLTIEKLGVYYKYCEKKAFCFHSVGTRYSWCNIYGAVSDTQLKGERKKS